MFYVFHHIPKCGGTSFKAFLKSVFDVTEDYIGSEKVKRARYERRLAARADLAKLKPTDCLSGHFNLPDRLLSVRYPELESLQHRKFSLIRDPLQRAQSAVYFAIKRGRAAEITSERVKLSRICRYANLIARQLEIRDADHAEEVMDRYWFIAPLDHADTAVRLIEAETGRKGIPMPVLNVTERPDVELSQAFIDDFRERAALDYHIHALAVARFKALLAEQRHQIHPAAPASVKAR